MRPIAKLAFARFVITVLLATNYPIGQIASAQDPTTYLPFLLHIQAAPAQLGELADAGVIAYTPVLTVPDQYFAGGDLAALQQLEAAGALVSVLDEDVTGKVYYLADGTAEDAAALATQSGTVVYQDPRQFLVAVPAADEERFVTALSSAGIDLMPYRGQTVTLYVNVYNNGAGSLASNYLDEVSVRACVP